MQTRELAMRPVSIAVYPLACLVVASIAGCATERLEATPPTGVNLTGEWKFNPNLSDDPDKLADPDTTPQRAPGSHRGHGGGRGGGGGMPPIGSPGGSGNDFTSATGSTPGAEGSAPADASSAPEVGSSAPAAAGNSTPGRGDGFGFLRVALTEQATPLPPTGTPATGGPTMSRGMSINRLLKAPVHVSITQKESTLILKTDMPDGTHTTDQYTAGTSNTIPYGQDSTADRSVGWRGPVFVVTTTAKKGGWREDDFALDDDGRLIMTTQTKGGRLGKLEITRVYDRVRGAGAD